jgi:hypothetical protein
MKVTLSLLALMGAASAGDYGYGTGYPPSYPTKETDQYPVCSASSCQGSNTDVNIARSTADGQVPACTTTIVDLYAVDDRVSHLFSPTTAAKGKSMPALCFLNSLLIPSALDIGVPSLIPSRKLQCDFPHIISHISDSHFLLLLAQRVNQRRTTSLPKPLGISRYVSRCLCMYFLSFTFLSCLLGLE